MQGLMGAMEERPPFVKFERKPVEQRKSFTEGGEVFFIDVDFAIITPQGTKDVVEKRVEDWFAYLSTMVQQGRYNPEWLKGYKAAFQAWKEGQDMPLNGSALKNWPAITPSELKKLTTLNIHTIEDLASMPEEGIGHIGPGGRSLRARAQDWLESKLDRAPTIAKLDSLRVANEQLNADNALMREQIAELQNEVKALQNLKVAARPALPSLEQRLEDAQAAQGPDPEDEILRKL